MRSNLEHNLARNLRHSGQKFTVMQQVLSGVLVLLNGGPNVHFLNPETSNRTVYLPPYIAEGGQQLWLFNTGILYTISVLDSNGVAIGDIAAGSTGIFTEYANNWSYFLGSHSVTPEPATIVTTTPYTITVADTYLYINVAGPVTLNLPTAALWLPVHTNGHPLTIKDISGAARVNNIIINRAGSDTIDGATSFQILSDYGGVRIRPPQAGSWAIV